MKKSLFLVAVATLLIAISCTNADDFPGLSMEAYYPNMPMQDGMIAPPDEPASGDKFDKIQDNPFIKTSENAVSTFSVDADGASYAIMRRHITNGYDFPPSAARIEEFLNYFTFNYPDPTGDESVSINAETGVCPWAKDHRLIRLGIKGKSQKESELPKSNYVFLIDVSGSMSSKDKLDLLKSGLIELVDNLPVTDRISIVTYSGKEELLLESTLVKDAATIKKAIRKLTASGATNGSSAITMAYKEAQEHFIEGGNNRIILGTDGDFNVGVTSTDALVEMVENYAKKGIYLTVCGFGLGNLNDAMMEKISNSGNGTYEYIDCEDEMMKVFVHERNKFVSVASDSKIQITFDPEYVDSYRLIGYENRVLSNEDFENDEKDAGEIGAGQTITALYEFIPTDKYSDKEEVGKFDFRYKKNLGEESRPLETKIVDATNSTELQFAAGVAAYGMILRDSEYKGESTFTMAKELVQKGLSFDPNGYRKSLVDIIGKAEKNK